MNEATTPAAPEVSDALKAMRARLLGATATADPEGAEAASAASTEEDDGRSPLRKLAPAAQPEHAQVRQYAAGKAVFREGELTYELYMLMEGKVDIFVGPDKVASLDAATAAGAYLGEIGSLLRTPRTATVKAVTPCRFLVFPDAKTLFQQDPAFGLKLSTTLAERLARSNEHVDLVMRALYKAKVKDEVLDAVKGAFQGKESHYQGKKGLFG